MSSLEYFEKRILNIARKFMNPQTAYYVSLIGAVLMLVGSFWYDEIRMSGYLLLVNWMGASIWIIGFGLYLYATYWTDNYTPEILSGIANLVLLIQGIRYNIDLARTISALGSSAEYFRISINPGFIIIPLFALTFTAFLYVLKKEGEISGKSYIARTTEPQLVPSIKREKMEVKKAESKIDWNEIELRAELGDLTEEELRAYVKEQLDELQLRFDIGELTEEEYKMKKEEILQKAREITKKIKFEEE